LLQPFNKQAASDDEDGAKSSAAKRRQQKKHGKGHSDSSSEESEEDFGFLEQELKDNKELDEVSQRMLSGIIQAPPKNMKRFDKMTKEEIWAKRRQRGDILSGDDDEFDDEEFGTIGHGGDSIDNGVSGAKMRNKARMRRNQVGTQDGSETGHPPCPDGFDAAKWAQMSLEEKCKYLGIDVKEWLKMNRE